MQISSEKISDKFFEINNCDIFGIRDRAWHTLRENGRVDYYIMYILQGECIVIENGEEFPVGKGGLILYLPGERQDYRFCKETRTVYAYAHFSGTACQSLLADLDLLGKRILSPNHVPHCEWLFREVVHEFYLKKPFWQTTATSLFLQFLTVVARKASAQVPPRQSPEIDEVIKYMHRHCESNHPISFYASMCHLSEGRFSHAFKDITGLPPKQYLLKIKVETACRLLSSTSLTPSDIAASVGIEDINYFGRLIKKQTGKTPGQLR